MATIRQLSRWWIVVLTSLAVLGIVFVAAVGPAWWGWNPDMSTPAAVSDTGPITRLPTPADMQMRTKRLPTPNFAPDLSNLAQDPRFARFDNIVVEVKPDGTLWVLGEPMGMEAFRSLLGDQIQDALRTYVTIRPDENCTYRHIGRIISACQEVGIPHQMVATPAAQAASVTVDSPA